MHERLDVEAFGEPGLRGIILPETLLIPRGSQGFAVVRHNLYLILFVLEHLAR